MSKKRYILTTIVLMIATIAAAQHISVSAPAQVAVGENFRVAFTIPTQDVEDFRSNIRSTDEVEVIAGPYTSQQSSIQMINGHTTSSSSITYTYTLYANKSGTFTIPAAHAKVNGRNAASKPQRITISGHARATQQGTPRMHGDYDDEPRMKAAGTPINGRDLFIKVEANKKHVHEQEPILLTYKVYTTLELTQLEGKMPDLTGFHTQEVKLPQQKSFHVERVNGHGYRAVTWSQYVMYPQMTGTLKIPSITFHGIVVQENRSVDPFEAFFNGGSGYVEVKRAIVAPGLTVQVDPLPARPAGFSGGVGKFNISAQIDKTTLKAGDPLNIRVVVGGIGNLKLLKQPQINFPKDFDKYDAKVTDKTRLTANGVEGNMVYDFLAVPRNKGSYTIPAVKFIYYDTDANAYRTIQTQPFSITVTEGSGKNSVDNYEDTKDQDIHDIKTSALSIRQADDFFFGSTAYTVSILVIVVIFFILFVLFRQRAIDRADVVRRKGRQANKVALKRLRKAQRLMCQARHDACCDEVLHALWGYVGDKLNMPAVNLNRENIHDNLATHGVDKATIDKFIAALDECEFERYAPGDPSGNMSRTFESAVTAITEIEKVMKKHHQRRKDVPVVGIIVGLFILLPLSAPAAPSAPTSAAMKSRADSLYRKGDYQQAIKDYQNLLRQGVSAELYYNLGNAYYRTDNITQALLAYERASLLSPGDKDIRFNLQFARNKTIDKITPRSEMFFVTWYHAIVNLTSVDRWAAWALASILVSLVLTLVYLFASPLWMRKTGFYGAATLLAIFLLCNLFAWQQKRMFDNRTGAIVTAPTVNVKATPSATSADNFVIHEGTRVDITDKGMKQWRGVRLADGREGWVKTSQIEEI